MCCVEVVDGDLELFRGDLKGFRVYIFSVAVCGFFIYDKGICLYCFWLFCVRFSGR